MKIFDCKLRICAKVTFKQPGYKKVRTCAVLWSVIYYSHRKKILKIKEVTITAAAFP